MEVTILRSHGGPGGNLLDAQLPKGKNYYSFQKSFLYCELTKIYFYLKMSFERLD